MLGTRLSGETPPPPYDKIAGTPSHDGLAEYFARYDEVLSTPDAPLADNRFAEAYDYESTDYEDVIAASSRDRFNVVNLLSKNADSMNEAATKITRQMEMERETAETATGLLVGTMVINTESEKVDSVDRVDVDASEWREESDAPRTPGGRISRSMDAERRPITRVEKNGPSLTKDSKSLEILLAEDNIVNQRLALKILEKYHHRVTVVGNGREALEAARKNKYDAILMDISMPVMVIQSSPGNVLWVLIFI
jgi:hypothetical protein